MTAGDCLAAYVARQRPGANLLRLGLSAQNGAQSPGALASRLDVMSSGGAWIEDGEVRRGPVAHTSFRATIDERTHVFVAAPVADLAAVRRLGIPNVVAGLPAPRLLAPVLRWLAPLLARVARMPAVRRFVERRATRTAPAHDAAPPVALRSFAWAEALDAQGTSSALLELGEGYQFAASAMVHAAERLTRDGLAGAFTPAAAFGPDFVLALPGVTRRDLKPAGRRALVAAPGAVA